MVVLASHGGRTVAGSMYFHFGDMALYKSGASDRKYQHLRANNLVMWEAIRWYCRNGYKNLCFGRTEPENKGLLQFKRGWGTKERTIRYYRYDLVKKAFVQDKSRLKGFHNAVFMRMPTPLLRFTGELLYKHMG
jgi:lipid II:glycine glycyltransferase (peptidoglycan interpeptide bridge formation enzyme)